MSFLQIIRTNEIFTEVSLFPKEKVFHSSLDNTLSKNKALEVAKKRKQWLYLVTKHPEKSTKELRAIKPQGSAVYAWLYRNDRHWLLKHPPRNTRTKSTKNRIDWPLRDLEHFPLIQVHSPQL